MKLTSDPRMVLVIQIGGGVCIGIVGAVLLLPVLGTLALAAGVLVVVAAAALVPLALGRKKGVSIRVAAGNWVNWSRAIQWLMAVVVLLGLITALWR
jgi:hypothetical protein